MIVAACPSCRENVTVPIDAQPSSIVRCPLCNAECRLEQFLAQLPPSLIVLTEPDTSVEADPITVALSHAQDTVAHDLASVAESSGADEEHHLPAFDFTPSAEDVVASPRDGVRRTPRRRTNTTWEIAKIVGGALLAVPAAQIILWWCVPYSWKRDLLGIGPAVSRVVPWVVPAKFHAPSRRTADAPDEDGTTVASSTRRNGSDSRWRSSLPSLDTHPVDAPRVPAASRPGESSSDHTPPGESAGTTKRDPSPAAPPTTDQRPVEPGTDASRTEPEPPAAQPSNSAPPPTEQSPNREFSADDLQAALERAVQASVAWDSSLDLTPAKRDELTDEFYGALAALGETLAYMAPGNPNVRELAATAQEWLQSLERQPKKLVLIGTRATTWLDQPQRPNRGVALFGTVNQIRREGDLFATDLELATPQRQTVSVFSPFDPAGTYAPGDRIVMLGTILTDPAKNLRGYAGTAPTAIMGSFPVRLQ